MTQAASTIGARHGAPSLMRETRNRALFAALFVLAGVLFLAEGALGPVAIPPVRIAAALSGAGTVTEQAILFQIRLPRAVLGLAVGTALGLSGAALQGLLRNPLAEPGLIGVTAGASLGAVLVIVLGATIAGDLPQPIQPMLLPIGAFLGAIIVIAILFSLVRGASGSGATILILTGVAINAIVAAVIGALVYVSDDQQLRDLTFWTLGSLGNADSRLIGVVVLLTVSMVPVYLMRSHALDLLQLGDRAAFHSGLDVSRARLLVALATALSVGAVTAAAGPIGFIGLVAPHIARMLVGPSHKGLLPASALIGASLVLLADLAVRLAVPPAEPPIGLATSLIGGPFFLWLLLRQRARGRPLA